MTWKLQRSGIIGEGFYDGGYETYLDHDVQWEP
jgi:hypothetical protein